MIAYWPNAEALWGISGELAVTLAIVGILLAPFFSLSRSNTASGIIALVGLVAGLVLTTKHPTTAGEVFNGMVVVDPAVRYWKQLLLIFVIGVVGIWFTATRRALKPGEGPEFFTLLLSSTVGMMLMGGTTNLLMIVLASEIASMPSYVLAGFRKLNRTAAEAAIKFVLFGAVSTAVMIYGISLIYGTHGTLSLSTIADELARDSKMPLTTAIGLIGLLVGLLFKLSAVPMHFWAPDVFEGSHVDVAAFLSVASKGAGLVLLMRIATLFADVSPVVGNWIAVILAVIAVITMTIGNLGALQQTSAKRILAYSSIAHAGYMLAAVALAPLHDALTITGIYLAIYVLMNLAAFAVVGVVEATRGSDHLNSFQGLAVASPMLAIALAVGLLSMVGLPPMGGFFAKLRLMTLLGSHGGWWWIVLIAVAINSIISLAYYARLLKPAFLEKTDGGDPIVYHWSGVAIAAGVLTIASFIFIGKIETASMQFAEQYLQVPTLPAPASIRDQARP